MSSLAVKALQEDLTQEVIKLLSFWSLLLHFLFPLSLRTFLQNSWRSLWSQLKLRIENNQSSENAYSKPKPQKRIEVNSTWIATTFISNVRIALKPQVSKRRIIFFLLSCFFVAASALNRFSTSIAIRTLPLLHNLSLKPSFIKTSEAFRPLLIISGVSLGRISSTN